MRKNGSTSLALLVLVVLMAACGCQSRHPLAGKYQAVDAVGKPTGLVLTLDPSGKGTWTGTLDEVEFRWEVRNREIWLHTRSGGVVIGTLTDRDAIRMVLPGVGKFLFQRGQGRGK